MSGSVIVAGARTPMGRFNGGLAAGSGDGTRRHRDSRPRSSGPG